MRIAKHSGKRLRPLRAAPRARRKRPVHSAVDAADRRLFLQLASSAVMVALAVMVSVVGGELSDSMVAAIESTTNLEEVNAVLSSTVKRIPVFGQLFSEDGAIEVFGSSKSSETGASPSQSFVLTPLEPQPTPGDAAADSTDQSGFDAAAFEALPDIPEEPYGGVKSAAVPLQSDGLPVFRFVKIASGDSSDDAQSEPATAPAADILPDNCTLEYQALPYPLSLPLDGAVTSRFGARCDPAKEESAFHHGLDLAAPAGTAIRPVASGTVIETGYNTIYGNYLVLQHAGGLTSKYAHCQSLLVKEGDRVKPSTKLATVGSTGSSTGNHLHLELRLSGIFLDPAIELGILS